MKDLGVIRKIDHLGRLVIPMEVRRSQGWTKDTPMEMFMSKEGLVIRPYQQESTALITELEAVKNFTDNVAVKEHMEKVIEFLKK